MIAHRRSIRSCRRRQLYWLCWLISTLTRPTTLRRQYRCFSLYHPSLINV